MHLWSLLTCIEVLDGRKRGENGDRGGNEGVDDTHSPVPARTRSTRGVELETGG